MYNDTWILSLLLTKLFCLLLLAYSIWHGIPIVWRWQSQSSSALQLSLERKTYLISSIVSLVLAFEVLGGALFVAIVNTHLPSIIKGAMCAAGVLGSNVYGLPTLLLKLAAIFAYIAFLALQYLDDAEPAYPLTPQKYIYLFPIIICSITDFALLLLFFGHLNPDRIVTCCSVNFIGQTASDTQQFFASNTAIGAIVLLWGILGGGLLGVSYWKKKLPIYLETLLYITYVFLTVYTLKNFFVKYIYGLPSHFCLYDTLLSHYYYVGFLLFLLYFIILGGTLVKLIFYKNIKKLTLNLNKPIQQLNQWRGIALFLSIVIPLLYWIFWQGDL